MDSTRGRKKPSTVTAGMAIFVLATFEACRSWGGVGERGGRRRRGTRHAEVGNWAQVQRAVFGIARPCVPIRVACSHPLGVALGPRGQTCVRPFIIAQPLAPHQSQGCGSHPPPKSLQRYWADCHWQLLPWLP